MPCLELVLPSMDTHRRTQGRRMTQLTAFAKYEKAMDWRHAHTAVMCVAYARKEHTRSRVRFVAGAADAAHRNSQHESRFDRRVPQHSSQLTAAMTTRTAATCAVVEYRVCVYYCVRRGSGTALQPGRVGRLRRGCSKGGNPLKMHACMTNE